MASRNDTTPPTYICFVRHGTTPTTGKVLPGTAPGLALAERGRAEAAEVGERLAALGSVTALYASPVERAAETAGAIASRIGVATVLDEDLADVNVGAWTGKSLALMRRRPEWRRMLQHPSGFRFPGGESFAELQARVSAAVERITLRHRGEVVVAVSHADPIKVALTEALGSPFDLLNRIVIAPCSTSAVVYGDGAPAVLTTNSFANPALVGVPSRDRARGATRSRRSPGSGNSSRSHKS